VPTRWSANTVLRLLAVVCLAITFIHLLDGNPHGATVTLLAFVLAEVVAAQRFQEMTRIMSKPNKSRFKLSQIRESQANRTGSAIEVETDDGQVFEVPTPHFWPDEASQLIGKGRDVELATMLLGGEESYAKFKAAGGRAADLGIVLTAYAKDQGIGTPGESGASSDS
jgi:hypothetical protein